ncbi:helix-turn-helix transcriptional regulator [uncultured Amnibacterium sp.]|uniref:helix-turn-helix domain-containing protein n=1 Tax=uncultured Amnibacterium sp. TaxID=1631851 RepID=UPI0035C9951E
MPTSVLALIFEQANAVPLRPEARSDINAPSTTELSSGTINEARLTEREREVAKLLAQGLTNKQISAELKIALGTTKRHLSNIFQKTGQLSRTQLALLLTTPRVEVQ